VKKQAVEEQKLNWEEIMKTKILDQIKEIVPDNTKIGNSHMVNKDLKAE
jgi:hypothetical protein